MTKRLLGHDPLTGITEYFHYDHTTDTSFVETTQNVEPVLDWNKALQNDDENWKRGVKNDFAMYASIPLVVQLRWLNEYGMADWPLRPGNEKHLFKLLNSPEWRYLKTTNKIHTGRS